MNKLRGFLINPWKKTIEEVQVEPGIHAWHKLLQCDCLDVASVGMAAGKRIDCWVDDEGLLKEPQAPFFKLAIYPQPLCGYALVLATDAAGDSVSIPECLTLKTFVLRNRLQFEAWEERMEPIDYPQHVI